MMHMFATSTAEEVLKLSQLAPLVETPSDWGDRLDPEAASAAGQGQKS
jgi:hypothetical protein